MNKTAGRIKNATGASRKGRLSKVLVSVEGKSVARLPHEQDESVDSQSGDKQKIIQQASADIKRGLTDTDRGEESNRAYQKLK